MHNIFLSKYIVHFLEQYNKTKKYCRAVFLWIILLGPCTEGTTLPQKGVEMWRVVANVLKKKLKRETIVTFSRVRM
jgi:hypothetical protein